MRRRRKSDEWDAEGWELVAIALDLTEAFVIFRAKRGIFYSSAGSATWIQLVAKLHPFSSSSNNDE